MKTICGPVALVSTLMLAFACSSSSSSSGASGNASCAFAAAGGTGQSSACEACAQNSCGSQINGYESGCSDYLSCVCPGGTYDGALTQQCASKAQQSGCTSASESTGACVQQNCASQCNSGSSSGGSSGSSSGGGSGSGSGSGGSSGSGSGGSPNMVWCSFPTQCNNVGTANQCPTSAGGMVVSSCPSAGLVGCCTTGPEEICYYSGANAQQLCTMKGGTWSTTWSSTP